MADYEELRYFLLVFDAISISLIIYFFLSLKTINDELCQIMKKNFVKMSDFTIQINQLKLDKTTHDLRMLKMKIWIHFS
jgi:hypothetical protein